MDLSEFLHGFQNGEYQFAKLREFASGRQPDRILKGKYCEVKCYLISRNEGAERWHFSPYTIAVGSHHTPSSEEEKIAHAISKMPNTDYFINFTGFDQVSHWIVYRDHSTELALCFWANQDTQNSYLQRKLQAGAFDQFSHNYLYAEAKMLKSLWKILIAREQEIESFCRKSWGYPFNSVREFYIEAIKEDLEGEFSACLKRRFIYKSSEIKQLAILKRKAHKECISAKEEKNLYRLVDQYVPSATWFNRLLKVAEHLAANDDLIMRYLNEYQESLDALNKLQIQRDCSPNFRHHLIGSHVWEGGQYRSSVNPSETGHLRANLSRKTKEHSI